ncbi:hypothetical protein ACG98H_04685 [Corynebacterium sp. L4756]|uniref:hypothetical protein n=1 Tax=unclassified Corynebacterium TaxID=2624378 RepID=UPI00374D719F
MTMKGSARVVKDLGNGVYRVAGNVRRSPVTGRYVTKTVRNSNRKFANNAKKNTVQ